MPYIKISSKGKYQIDRNLAFFEMVGQKMPSDDVKIGGLIRSFDQIIKDREKSISNNAINNYHGYSYEQILAISGWNYFVKHDDADLILNLPNVTKYDIWNLYVERLRDLIDDLKAKLSDIADVRLISSNPDFVIIGRKLALQKLAHFDTISTITIETAKRISELYKVFENTCEYEDIKGFASAKFTLRPDRRLQIPHEGSLMKAIYTHLQTREWIIDPQGLRYYAITTSLTNADMKALKTVATHSITTVNSLPQRAVDEVFAVDSIQQANTAFEKMLTYRAFT